MSPVIPFSCIPALGSVFVWSSVELILPDREPSCENCPAGLLYRVSGNMNTIIRRLAYLLSVPVFKMSRGITYSLSNGADPEEPPPGNMSSDIARNDRADEETKEIGVEI